MAFRALVSEQLKSLFGVVVIVMTILGSALFGMSRYDTLDAQFVEHQSGQHMKELREENRLATIEAEIKHLNERAKETNKLLEKILEELR